MNRSGILKYSADLRSIGTVSAAVGFSLLPFTAHLPIWMLILCLIVAMYARTLCPYAQHNHAHLSVFNSKVLNHIYDVMLTQVTGYPTSQWELHHNRGHHRHFLRCELDVARVTHLKTGKVMSRWWYAIRGNFTILLDSIRIGVAEGREGKKTLLPKLFGEVVVQMVITFTLIYLNGWLAVVFFIVPNVAAAFLIWWESYPHHLQVPNSNIYDGSVTITARFFNFETFNIGHHTAHHEKPTLHWSLLPARTEAIRNRIPEMCLHDVRIRSSRRLVAESMRKSLSPRQPV